MIINYKFFISIFHKIKIFLLILIKRISKETNSTLKCVDKAGWYFSFESSGTTSNSPTRTYELIIIVGASIFIICPYFSQKWLPIKNLDCVYLIALSRYLLYCLKNIILSIMRSQNHFHEMYLGSGNQHDCILNGCVVYTSFI